jgi:hypothetical protein
MFLPAALLDNCGVTLMAYPEWNRAAGKRMASRSTASYTSVFRMETLPT